MFEQSPSPWCIKLAGQRDFLLAIDSYTKVCVVGDVYIAAAATGANNFKP